MAILPPPINGTEQYLAAVHDRLGEQNELLARILDQLAPPSEALADVPAADPETVELREPAEPELPGDALAEPVPVPQPSRRRTTKTTNKKGS